MFIQVNWYSSFQNFVPNDTVKGGVGVHFRSEIVQKRVLRCWCHLLLWSINEAILYLFWIKSTFKCVYYVFSGGMCVKEWKKKLYKATKINPFRALKVYRIARKPLSVVYCQLQLAPLFPSIVVSTAIFRHGNHFDLFCNVSFPSYTTNENRI